VQAGHCMYFAAMWEAFSRIPGTIKSNNITENVDVP
jgi:hypothetical protein